MRLVIALAFCVLAGCGARAQAPRPRAMIAAANPAAVEAGLVVLRAGGSAADAAVAVQAALGLVEPQSSGLGGGAFLTYYDARARRLTAYDGRETAPAGATPEMFLRPGGGSMSFSEAKLSGRSAGAPGAVAMLALAQKDHGRRPWATLFEDTARLADAGFTVGPRLAGLVAGASAWAKGTDLPAYFTRADGTLVKAGDRLKNPAYAATLRRLAAGGPSALLDRPHRRRHRGPPGQGAPAGNHDPGRSGRLSPPQGRGALPALPRLDGVRAEPPVGRPRHPGGPGPAGAHRHRHAGPGRPGRLVRTGPGRAADVRRRPALHGRPGLREGSAGGSPRPQIPRRAGQADRRARRPGPRAGPSGRRPGGGRGRHPRAGRHFVLRGGGPLGRCGVDDHHRGEPVRRRADGRRLSAQQPADRFLLLAPRQGRIAGRQRRGSPASAPAPPCRRPSSSIARAASWRRWGRRAAWPSRPSS